MPENIAEMEFSTTKQLFLHKIAQNEVHACYD